MFRLLLYRRVLRDIFLRSEFILPFFNAQGDVWICMEVMSTCLDKLYHDLHRPFPEKVLGKVTVAVSLFQST